jgi:hypothetical protein
VARCLPSETCSAALLPRPRSLASFAGRWRGRSGSRKGPAARSGRTVRRCVRGDDPRHRAPVLRLGGAVRPRSASARAIWIVRRPGLSAGRADPISSVGTEVILLIQNRVVAGRRSVCHPFGAERSGLLHLHVVKSTAGFRASCDPDSLTKSPIGALNRRKGSAPTF